ncbi:hypothetical protein SAMN05414139_05528 [Burkholderia sp. D7]|jgi:hypothetical protein|nr:hypothetical protein SAMN05414139_05528 [Burkholderia sp. D7]
MRGVSSRYPHDQLSQPDGCRLALDAVSLRGSTEANDEGAFREREPVWQETDSAHPRKNESRRPANAGRRLSFFYAQSFTLA